jgi:DNA-binding MarR family transcriptional regulator
VATAPASQALEDQLCFALYSASRAVTARYRPILEALDLTYPQYLVMITLWASAPTTVSALGRELYLDSGTLSPLLKRLETAGLLTRHRSRTDERSVEIRLTAKGRRLRRRAETVPGQICAAMGFDADGLTQLGEELRLLAANVRSDLAAAG